MPKRKASQKEVLNRPKKPITTDPRFSSVHSDPRFAPPKRRDSKVVLDSRFKTRLDADTEFKQKRVVDKYGRKVDKNASETELKRYYRMEDEDEDEEDEKALVRPGYDPARGEGLIGSSSEEEDTEEEVDETEDVFETAIEEESVPRGEETSTFAVVNLDWDNVRAEDLMVAFSSFAPAGGRVLSVSIYPSEFGKERMAREEMDGPPREIFTSAKDAENEPDDDVEVKEDKGEEFDSSKLRKYQLQRLRYYYAVVKCDSVATSRRIYEGCDGTEYETTANFFDLRYVPDGMEFDDKPRDTCTKVPSAYRPNEFVTDALQHSKVRLTWDETPAERLQFARRAFSRREVEEMDFKAYLASSGSESDAEEENKDAVRERYRKLLLDSKDDTGFDEKGDVDMEITFTPGLSTGTEAMADSADEEENTIEKYKRRERERRKERMDRNKKDESENEELEDKKAKKSKKGKKVKKSANEIEEDDRRKAELELLMMGEDEDNNLKHFDMREIIKSQKQKKNKKLRNKNKVEAGDDFKIDVADSRFNEMYDHHEFAIDPSRPQFKDTNAMRKLLEERRRRQNKNTDE
ncbi:hypothetical protein V1512DRAFT_276056 [Lipomyces arxii]|uniref:uncharacterized protein n=1 Tax=Lipomyces arxii TaxID=56418 RepID=UPI0034CF9603